jgi:hypothetical protein
MRWHPHWDAHRGGYFPIRCVAGKRDDGKGASAALSGLSHSFLNSVDRGPGANLLAISYHAASGSSLFLDWHFVSTEHSALYIS